MPDAVGQVNELDLGFVTAEELVISSYESLKVVLSSAIAQMASQDVLQARAIMSQLANDIDNERAKFILNMRAIRAEEEAVVQGEVVEEEAGEGTDAGTSVPPPITATVVDEDGFEYEQVLDVDTSGSPGVIE